MLAQVTNEALDNSIKSLTIEDGIKNLSNIVTLMSCLEDKDKYLYYLSNNLSKRLLDNDIDSINCLEWEKQLILIIKSKLGSEFSKNLEAMIADVEQCYEKKPAIQEYFSKHSNEKLIKSFHVNVLSNCEWMLPTIIEAQPSDNIILIQKLFEDMFTNDPSNLNKRLEWNYSLGIMELKFNCLEKEFSVLCKPYHYFLLQLFSKDEALTIGEISSKLKIAKTSDLFPIVDSLVIASSNFSSQTQRY